jgi:hypothetical protein
MDVGVVINQYEIVEHIGRGGMADVWSARDKKLNRMVAIKTIAHGLSQDADPVDMFKQEAQTIAQMEHPHVLPIYDFGDYEGQLYIVMRYVSGGSLDDLLRRGPLSVEDTLRMGHSIAKALDYAHQNKIVHLDLKPPNVLLDSSQSPYLADFGLATVLDPEGKALNPGSGTLLYMAPEQLTSELIDYRADLYSFAIVMFHMLTGQLPFEGSAPLALKQMQFHENLPPVDDMDAGLPPQFSDILRRATAIDPDERQTSLTEVMDELTAIHQGMSGMSIPTPMIGIDEPNPLAHDAAYVPPSLENLEGADAEILEAVDIYSRARHNWAGGNGRFLLGVTNFMVMNDYYMYAPVHGLDVDEHGKQMLLRGALEYDRHVDYWWGHLNDAHRRWVCLHALRSGNAPARVRALYRLETLPDAERPVIPRLVAQMLQVETNEEALIAALTVLGTRFRLMHTKPQYQVKTEYRGRLLTTLTRSGVELQSPSNWREVVYSPEIDLLIAETALDYGMPRVAEFAARVIGRMGSITAVRRLANEQRDGRKGALRALAIVRDEAPSLPPVVSAPARLYAWINNTVRRLFSDPLQLVLRFTFAMIGAGLAMGVHIWGTFGLGFDIFEPQRWINALSVGLLFGFAVAILVIVAGEFSARLRGFWPWWVRLIVSGVFGFAWASLIWYQFSWGFLNANPIGWNVINWGAFGLASGVVITALFGLRSFIAMPLTAFLLYLPINITYFVGRRFQDVGPFTFEADEPLRFLGIDFTSLFEIQRSLLPYGNLFPGDDGPIWRYGEQIYTIAIPFALLVAFGAHFLTLVNDGRGIMRWLGRSRHVEGPEVAEVDVYDTPTMPVPAPASHIEHMVQPDALDTELDVNVSRSQQILGQVLDDTDRLKSDNYMLTEIDVNQGRSRAEAPEADEPPKTEVDVNLGRQEKTDAQEDDPQSKSKIVSKRVNLGTGIRIDDTPPADDDNDKTDRQIRWDVDKDDD